MHVSLLLHCVFLSKRLFLKKISYIFKNYFIKKKFYVQVNVTNHVNVVNHTSHPHVVGDGTVYNLGISICCTGPHYNIVKFPPPLCTGIIGN